MSAPDPQRALALYRGHAAGYDASARATQPLRRRTVAKLDLRPGDRVLDVACGTGLSFPLLRAAVGAAGRVVGVELSPDMAALARVRVADAGWDNVELLVGAMEGAALAGPLDAALFHFTHDVLRSPAALERILAALRPGARVALAGMKLAPPWLFPVNVWVRRHARPYMTTLEGLEAPWDRLAPRLEGFRRESALWGTAYVGWGRVR